MTYCVAMKLKEGLLFASDSRTNAGVDHISVFSKMHRFELSGERQIVLLNAGNLATTQAVVSRLRQDIKRSVEGNLHEATSMFDVAKMVGKYVRELLGEIPEAEKKKVDFGCTFLVGGHILGEEPRLFLVYPEGNFIEATRETPFFQIGESKYGKPILDRVLHYHLSVREALKCTLVSFDSTMRSNLSVGQPIDVLCLLENDLVNPRHHRVEEGDPAFDALRRQWSEGLRHLFSSLPNIDWWDRE